MRVSERREPVRQLTLMRWGSSHWNRFRRSLPSYGDEVDLRNEPNKRLVFRLRARKWVRERTAKNSRRLSQGFVARARDLELCIFLISSTMT